MEGCKKPAHGEFCWMERHLKNVRDCKPFYTEFFGRKMQKTQSLSDFPDTELNTDKKPLGGMSQMGAEFDETPSH